MRTARIALLGLSDERLVVVGSQLYLTKQMGETEELKMEALTPRLRHSDPMSYENVEV